ncbi:MAG: HepT-like ribonuclease domain-containing protein [Varibaculum timonense]
MPLAEVRGMRNRMAHGYLDIDKPMLWETMSGEIVPLIENILGRIENYRKH